jgi:magnesium-transporting ATPase (P-type)
VLGEGDRIPADVLLQARNLEADESLPTGESIPVTKRAAAGAVLEEYGGTFLREPTSPQVVAVYRLAVLEADRSPQIARALRTLGREESIAALAGLLRRAQQADLLGPGGDRGAPGLVRSEEAPGTLASPVG